MIVFDTRRPGPAIRQVRLPILVAAAAVAFLLVLFITWEITSEITFTSTVTTILPGQLADSATSPVTTVGG